MDTAEPLRCLYAAAQILNYFYQLATVLVEMTNLMGRVKPMTKVHLGLETVLGSVQQSSGRNISISSFFYFCVCVCLSPKRKIVLYLEE